MSGAAPTDPDTTNGGHLDRTCPMCGEEFTGKLADHLHRNCGECR